MNFKYVRIVIIILAVSLLATLAERLAHAQEPRPVAHSIYDFKIKSLDQAEVDFTKFKGRFLLIVNTASKCGYTPQYKELQKLHELYGERLAVLGFPANNFLWQEPGDSEQIRDFCEKNYGVTFQMFDKISVKGKDKHPLYAWLEAKSGKTASWNFCKYLIGRDGEVIGFYPSKVSPLDKSIVDKILE
jgi:glutathione peroxidase